ncbi:MAG TPA: three-Cys-motif partner protein TcmP [Xanthomonadaceae bacterium]|jgi:three-Cys-motif partner protein
MSANGYDWTIDGPLPVLQDHSRAKHEVLRAYLVNYLRILAQSPHSRGVRVTLVDGFAGGGIYATPHGETVPGSPLILLNALKEARALVSLDRKERGIHGDYTIQAFVHLVESKPSTFEFLSRLIADEAGAHDANTSVQLHRGTFESALPAILKSIRAGRQRGGRSVFILDQYGWSKVRLSLVRSIFEQLPSAEVFLTWMIDNLVNFISEQTLVTINSGLRKAGLGDHLSAERLVEVKNAHQDAVTWRRAIQSLLADEIRATSTAAFCTPFYVIPRESHRGYWLLHLAQHLRANEEMKRIHWANNNLHHPGGSGFNMLGFIGKGGQLGFDHRFDVDAQAKTQSALHEDVPQWVSSQRGPVRFGDLVAMTANETPAQRSQLQAAVFELAQSRELMLRTLSGSKRRGAHCLEDDDVIELPRQLWLLPGI